MDKRALKILFDTYWSSAGWKREDERVTSPKDFEYAKSQGMMFDPVVEDHAQASMQLFASLKRLSRHQVANAFLASLSSRRLDWRSALGSYAVFQNITLHDPEVSNVQCDVCGMYLNQHEEDLNAWNFARHKWGGVGHDHLTYASFDLSLFLDAEIPKPTQEDLTIFRALISAISATPAGISSANLHPYFAKVIKSNKAERDVIISILGFCGILGTPEHPGYTDAFIPNNKRRLPDRRFVDMPYPACWWESSHGINRTSLHHYFGHIL